jgi:TldD protein
MKVDISQFLITVKPGIKKLIQILSEDFDYVSVLGTDSRGKQYRVQKTGVTIQDSFWNERGFVVRVYNGIKYSEFAFNNIEEKNIKELAEKIKLKVKVCTEKMGLKVNINKYKKIEEEQINKEFIGEVKLPYENINDKEIINKLLNLKEKAFLASDLLVDFKINFQTVHVSKIFLSNNKDLMQSYVWSEASILPIVREGNNTKFNYKGFSGLKGAELLEEIEETIEYINSSINKFYKYEEDIENNNEIKGEI